MFPIPPSQPHQSLEGHRRSLPSTGLAPTDDQSPIGKLDYDTFSLILQYVMAFDVDLDDLQAYLCHRVERVHPRIHYPGLVSREWHKLCISIPSLWRDIIYLVDTPSHTPEPQHLRLQTYLQRSQPLSIHLYLCRSRRIPHSLDLEEADSVEAALSACRNHLERIEVLVVETNQASSLPRALRLLGSENRDPHPLPRLKSLVLTSNVDDSILQPHPSSLPLPIHTQFLVNRVLTMLFVDGRSLLLMLQSSITRMGTGAEDVFTSMPMLEALGINNVTSCVDGFSIELVDHFFFDILPSFPRLTTLALDNFEPVDDRSETIQGSYLYRSTGKPLLPISLPRLIIKRTNHLAIEFVLGWIHPHTLVLINCYFSSPLYLPSFSKLVLIDISTDFDRALPKMIARWNGDHLGLHGCSCIDEGFWAALQRELLAQGDRTLAEISARPVLGRFKSVTVVDCPTNLPA